MGAWERKGEFRGGTYVSLSTFPEGTIDFVEGITICEIIVDGESVAKEEKTKGIAWCGAYK